MRFQFINTMYQTLSFGSVLSNTAAHARTTIDSIPLDKKLLIVGDHTYYIIFSARDNRTVRETVALFCTTTHQPRAEEIVTMTREMLSNVYFSSSSVRILLLAPIAYTMRKVCITMFAKPVNVRTSTCCPAMATTNTYYSSIKEDSSFIC